MSGYDRLGIGYAAHRSPDPRIAAAIRGALDDARDVVNVGAGTGSYEPDDRRVVAVEPSAVMVRQRPAAAAPATRASALRLPFRDGAFDAALAVLTLHHWPDWRAGLRELRRVARARVVLLSWDPACDGFWLVRDYLPEILAADRAIFPTMAAMAAALGPATVVPVPIPSDCRDGFLGAYWRRPEAYLDPAVRAAISSFARIGDPAPGLDRLRDDLRSGRWHDRHADLVGRDAIDLGYRLVVADGGG